MKKIYFLFLMAVAFSSVQAQTTNIQVFNNIAFYGGYAATYTTPPPPPGVIRHKNYLYGRKLTASELASIGSTLHLTVTVKAACDNYDRIGNVNIAFVPKDSSTYTPANVPRIEVARFITPFMNLNYSPTTVSYHYDINNLAFVLKDSAINSLYNLWIELEVFGVIPGTNLPAGCTPGASKEVFYGSLTLGTNASMPVQNNNLFIPVAMKKNFNNYQANATDTLGKTIRSFDVTVPDLSDASFFLITSNHGANSGGEEYNRRNHYVYVDGILKLTYKPGRTTCEPFRVYNTQPNGIYGNSPRSDAEWQSFSNWCPGDKIDIRRINMGALTAGTHRFTIEVPQAVFVGQQGNFPLSIYLHGKTSGLLEEAQGQPQDSTTTTPPPAPSGGIKLYPVPARELLTIEAANAQSIRMIDVIGRVVYTNSQPTNKELIKTSKFSPGLYVVQIKTNEGTSVRKILIAP